MKNQSTLLISKINQLHELHIYLFY